MGRIIVVEDDTTLRNEVVRLLELQGYTCDAITDFTQVAQQVLAAPADCVVLDLKLPGADGHAVCRDVRAQSDVPIIMLTSSDNEFDEVMSMNLGADDYVTKPYNPAVLIARIQSVLRRSRKGEPSAQMVHKGLTLDTARGSVAYADKETDLTRNELKILHCLLKQPGVIISRQDLMCELWQSDAFIDDNTLTVNINRLRKSLAGIGVPEGFLVTRRGQGYVIS